MKTEFYEQGLGVKVPYRLGLAVQHAVISIKVGDDTIGEVNLWGIPHHLPPISKTYVEGDLVSVTLEDDSLSAAVDLGAFADTEETLHSLLFDGLEKAVLAKPKARLNLQHGGLEAFFEVTPSIVRMPNDTLATIQINVEVKRA